MSLKSVPGAAAAAPDPLSSPGTETLKGAFRRIEVAINRPVLQTYSYEVEASAQFERGSLALVNFAGSDQVGVVMTDPASESAAETPETQTPGAAPQGKPRALKKAKILTPFAVITPDVMQMLEFGSRYYHYPLGQCFFTALPKILRQGGAFAYDGIPALRLAAEITDDLAKTVKSKEQQKILDILKSGPCRRKELRERGIASQSENALIKKGLVEKFDLIPDKAEWTELKEPLLREEPPDPSLGQKAAIDEIAAVESFKAFLLNGVTGSGKTEVYLRVIEKVLKKGRAVLVLVPEIALTPQTFERFYRRFNVPVSSMHSQLSDRERLDAYLDMSKSRAAILIGTRTALFTPIPRLGLIVVDEEHDSSFKQSDGFRYHCRDLAIMRAKIADCPIILGSATPSLESFYNVQRSHLIRLDLTERAAGATLPSCEIVDLRREEMSEGLRAGIGRTLEERIGEETVKGNQVLLFLNRRGFSHHLICHDCGHVFSCPNCDNLMTVHRHDFRLHCHICEYSFPLPDTCPECGGHSLLEIGFGTEQVEDYLRLRFPDVGIERIDRDTVTSKTALEQRLERVRSGKSQIMIGTQIISKGHDFPNVTLVGILDVDSSLFTDDYRSQESCAQLLTQVSGRAGRALKKGQVLIQTHYPENLLINSVADPAVSYGAIAAMLLEGRRELSLPPYTAQAFLLSNSSDRAEAHAYLAALYQGISAILPKYPGLQTGPVLSDKMEKRQNRFHFHILITAPDRGSLASFLDEVTLLRQRLKLRGDTRFAVEVDPLIMY